MIEKADYRKPDNEQELEEFLNSLNGTLKRINNLTYRLKYTNQELYDKYRSLFVRLQAKRDTSKLALKEVRLKNVSLQAEALLMKDIKL